MPDETNETNELNERDSNLMDSLLNETLGSGDAQDDQRVTDLLASIRAERGNADSAIVGDHRPSRMSRWFPVSAVSVAAAVLAFVVFVVQPGASRNAALAAVERSLQAENRPEVREYEVTVVTRNLFGKRRSRTHTLYVKGRDFAIRTAPLLGSSTRRASVWLGGNGDTRWLVPPIGAVQVGPESFLNNRLAGKSVIETPFLTVSTILDRITRFYDLELTSNVELTEAESTFMCDHVAGERSVNPKSINSRATPEHVELWADTQTGFARRVELKWNENGNNAGWLEASAQLVGTPDVASDFFEHTAHHEPDRTVRRIEN